MASAQAILNATGGSSGSVTSQLPSFIYGFSGPGIVLMVIGGILSFLIFFTITISILRAWNPVFLRDVCSAPGQCETISWWRSVWISAVIALIPTILVIAVIFAISARVGHSAAVLTEGALRSGLIPI